VRGRNEGRTSREGPQKQSTSAATAGEAGGAPIEEDLPAREGGQISERD